MTDRKSEFFRAEAEKFRRKAVAEACPDAREYYEALQRDFLKLAAGRRPLPAAETTASDLDRFKRVSS